MKSRWIAFLRAINIGNRRVTGDRLVAIFESLGFEHVSSYQASGNVLFSAPEPDADRIEQALEAALGYQVPTVLRSASAVREISTTIPFDEDELAASQRKVQVILLRNPIARDVMEAAWSNAPADDLLRPQGQDVFWLPRAGISDSALDLGGVERTIGPFTVRSHNTVSRLADRV